MIRILILGFLLSGCCGTIKIDHINRKDWWSSSAGMILDELYAKQAEIIDNINNR